MILPRTSFLQNIKSLLNLRTLITPEVLGRDFQALETTEALLISAASEISLASSTSTVLFSHRTDGLITPGTKMTNTGPFLWNRSSKIQFFTDICYLLCRRLLRPAYFTFSIFFDETQMVDFCKHANHHECFLM